MNLILLIIFSLFITIIFSRIYIYFFQDKNKIKNKELYKLIGNSGITLTNVSEFFGIVSFKDDFGKDRNIVCYSYRENINKGFRVLITDYDLNREMYIVDEYPK